MTIKPIKMLIAASLALPLFAAAGAVHAAPVISDHNYFPSAVHAQKAGSPLFDARASIDVQATSAAKCNYSGGPKLDASFCH
ncbi:MAG: hypothetical protein K2W78_00820 [Xanthobacteraceae bacterium]|nr:hypothetical protein [Xanthobacteraceae bacterium]